VAERGWLDNPYDGTDTHGDQVVGDVGVRLDHSLPKGWIRRAEWTLDRTPLSRCDVHRCRHQQNYVGLKLGHGLGKFGFDDFVR
jgi:hypothetical protein